MTFLRKTNAGILATGTAIATASVIHSEKYVLRERNVRIQNKTLNSPLSTTVKELKILHISDTHLMPYQKKKLRFVQQLAAQKPDLIVLTGDLIAHKNSISPLINTLSIFADIPGVFVYGSNDYFAPRLKNPFSYLLKDSSTEILQKPPSNLPTTKLTTQLEAFGWKNLNNSRACIKTTNWELSFVGVDDPHLQYDVFPEPQTTSGKHHKPKLPSLHIGLTHAPYTRILNKMLVDKCDLVFAGHTHGGQVCLPGNKALVTNCDIPTAYASGIFSYPLENSLPIKENGIINTALPTTTKLITQISAGMGTSPFTPFRTFCPPEAILLTISLIEAK